MAKALESPTCAKCAREQNLQSVKALYNTEIGICANCGRKTWVSPLIDWFRPKKPKATPKPKTKKGAEARAHG